MRGVEPKPTGVPSGEQAERQLISQFLLAVSIGNREHYLQMLDPHATVRLSKQGRTQPAVTALDELLQPFESATTASISPSPQRGLSVVSYAPRDHSAPLSVDVEGPPSLSGRWAFRFSRSPALRIVEVIVPFDG